MDVFLHPDVIEEINEQATEYQSRFTEGALDFLLAVEDTLGRIERLPNAAPRRSEKDPDIRGWQIKNTQSKLASAKRFPFVLIYQVQKQQNRVVVYQLWPARSNRPIKNVPKDSLE